MEFFGKYYTKNFLENITSEDFLENILDEENLQCGRSLVFPKIIEFFGIYFG